jgi:hypothetical protein
MAHHRDYPFAVTSSPKAIKALDYGYRNAIHYLIPAGKFGVPNLCPKASAACIFLCLGTESGRPAIRQEGELNNVLRSRIEKTRKFMSDRPAYLRVIVRQIHRQAKLAARDGMKLCVRLNGCSDVSWEMIRLPNGNSLMQEFPNVVFVDYTKILSRFKRKLPANYHLTFSHSGTNEAECIEALSRGINVAVCFETKPETWHGFKVIDGDLHDLRHLDPRGERGTVVALSPKGSKAKQSTNGFVIRQAA